MSPVWLVKFLVIFVFIFLGGCQQITEPLTVSPDAPFLAPTANAGPDQVAQVGGYVVLNGSQSSPGAAKAITFWQWTQDENNPAEVFLLTDSIAAFGLTLDGVYKFALTVSNDYLNSKPDEVIVRVLPRSEIIFPDPSLEAHVRYALRKPMGALSVEGLASIDSLHCVDLMVKNVTSLEGIELCSNLQYLFMGHQEIVDISPLKHMANLICLSLPYNRNLADISPLAGLTQLSYLDLDTCDADGIAALENLTELTYLNLSDNGKIKDISPIANMRKLQELWLGLEPIDDISPLAELTNLTFLWLGACKISDISPLQKLTELRFLYLNYNEINDIAVLSGLVNLERLYLRYNEIEDISIIKNLSELDFIKLGFNKISNILPLVENGGLRDGDYVGLSGNPLDQKSVTEYIPALMGRGVVVTW
ncbi:MAG TPA: leucine-rich repeat domain-containing protein [bacterium]|nr:leucine-rich repeat domain-containing protein [bacterium]